MCKKICPKGCNYTYEVLALGIIDAKGLFLLWKNIFTNHMAFWQQKNYLLETEILLPEYLKWICFVIAAELILYEYKIFMPKYCIKISNILAVPFLFTSNTNCHSKISYVNMHHSCSNNICVTFINISARISYITLHPSGSCYFDLHSMIMIANNEVLWFKIIIGFYIKNIRFSNWQGISATWGG